MILVKVFRAFNEGEVRYLVVGGVATILYGNPRFTKDLDIWVDPNEGNLQKMVAVFKKLKFMPRAPVRAEEFILAENRRRWKKEKGMLAFTFINPQNPFENVDLLFEGPVSFSKAYARKKVFQVEDVPIPTISRDDLIDMKEKAGREQDLRDVLILKKARKRKAREKKKK